MQRLLSPMHHTARLLPITALSAKQRHAMAALYLAHYNASSPALFQRQSDVTASCRQQTCYHSHIRLSDHPDTVTIGDIV